jgi:hypothetical protein
VKRENVLLACLLVAAALAAWPARGAETFAGVVPGGAAFYADTQGLESVWRGIERSNFWAKFAHLKVWEGVDLGRYERFRAQFAQNLGLEFSTANLLAVLGKEFAVAFYMDAAEGDEALPRMELLVVARMNPPETVEGMLEKLVERAQAEGDGEVLITTVEHRGAQVHTLKMKRDDPPIQLRWAVHDGTLVFGIANGPPRIEACLDCMAGEGAALAADPAFAKLISQAGQEGGSFFGEAYFDLAKVNQGLAGIGEDKPLLALCKQMIGMMSGSARAMAFTAHLDRGLRIKTVTEPGDEMAEIMDVLCQAAPAAGTHIKYVPPGALMYFGGNSLPPMTSVWQAMVKRLARTGLDAQVNDAIEQIELALGVDFEADVLGNLGPELAFSLDGFDMESGPFPFPKLTVLLQVKDTAKAQALVDKIIGLIEEAAPPEMGVTVTELSHQGATLRVVHVPLPIGMTITPTIGLTENFLFVSSGEAYAKATLDAAKSGVNLSSSPLYRSLGIPEKTNGVVVLNGEELVKAARALAGWLVTMAQAQGAGDEVKAQVDSTVLPLLDCLGAFKAVAGYSLVTPGGLSDVYIFRVEDLPAN